MQSRWRGLLELLTVAVWCWLGGTTPGQVTDPVRAESDHYTVMLARIKPDASGGQIITVRVRDKKRGEERALSFSNRTVRVDGLALIGDSRLLVLGKLGSGGDVVTFLDLETGAVLDTIWAWQFTLCPELGIAVYRFRYPPASPAVYDSHVVLAYDLTASPAENSRSSSSANLLPQEQRGYILYPEKNRLSRRVFIPAEDPSERRLVKSPFACCAPRKEIAFVEFYGGKMQLVRIDISGGLETPFVYMTEIPEEQFAVRDNPKARERWAREGVVLSSLIYEPGCRAVKLTTPQGDTVGARQLVIPINGMGQTDR